MWSLRWLPSVAKWDSRRKDGDAGPAGNLPHRVFLAYRKCRDGDGAGTEGLGSQWLAKLGTYPTDRNQSLILLVVPCFDCRQEPLRGHPATD